MAFRIFIAGADIREVTAPPGVEEAYDLMVGDGMDPDQAAGLAMAACRGGHDPMAFARHVTGLRGGLRRRRW